MPKPPLLHFACECSASDQHDLFEYNPVLNLNTITIDSVSLPFVDASHFLALELGTMTEVSSEDDKERTCLDEFRTKTAVDRENEDDIISPLVFHTTTKVSREGDDA